MTPHQRARYELLVGQYYEARDKADAIRADIEAMLVDAGADELELCDMAGDRGEFMPDYPTQADGVVSRLGLGSVRWTFDDAVRRLDGIGVDRGLASIHLQGCTEREHYAWICTADASEIRQYRERMLRDARDE